MRGRKQHLIGANHRTTMPARMVFLGVSSYAMRADADNGRVHHAFGAAAATMRRQSNAGMGTVPGQWRQGRADVLGFIRSTRTSRGSVWVFAYDLPKVMQLCGWWDLLTSQGVRVDGFALTDPPSFLKLTIDGCSFVWCDVLNYADVPLSTMAKWVGSSYVPGNRSPQDAAGLAQDAAEECAVIEQFVVGLLGIYRSAGGGCWATTISGLAWNAYRHSHLRSRIQVHVCARATALERAAYYGGEVRPYFVGQTPEPAYHLDVNGLYGWCMGEYQYPVQLEQVCDSMPLAEVRRLCDTHGVIARVEVDTLWQDCLVKKSGKSYRQRGRFCTVLPGPELAWHCDAGHVLSIGTVAVYRLAMPFSSWHESLHSLRTQYAAMGDSGGVQIAKRICNALSGKWAQRTAEWVEASEDYGVDQQGEFWYTEASSKQHTYCLRLGAKTYLLKGKKEWYHAFPAISAYITSYGRLYMARLRGIAGERRVYYQDTDSLFVSADGYTRLQRSGLVSDRSSGRLKLLSGPSPLLVRGVKSYLFGGHDVQAGLKPRHEPGLCGGFTQEICEGARQLLTHAGDGMVATRKADFLYRAQPQTYSVGADGWTEPLWARG